MTTCVDSYEEEKSKIEINLDEIAIGVAKFITRYHQYPEIYDYTFREAYNRSFYLEHIEISEDLVLSVKKKIKEVGLDTPIKCLFQSTTQ